MSPEWIGAIAAIATVVVIAASALAALIQLRHMRASNQMTSLMALREALDTPTFQEQFRASVQFLKNDLQKAEVRRKVLTAERLRELPEFEPVLSVGNIFENAGCLIKNQIVDADMFCDLFAGIVAGIWPLYAPFIAHRRRATGQPDLENFEYLAVICQDWLRAHPNGSYPPGVRRAPTPELWPEALQSEPSTGRK